MNALQTATSQTALNFRLSLDITDGKYCNLSNKDQLYIFLFAIEIEKMLKRLKFNNACNENCSIITTRFSSWYDHALAYFHTCMHLVDASSVSGSYNIYSLILGLDSSAIYNHSAAYFNVFSRHQCFVLNLVLNNFKSVNDRWLKLCLNHEL